MMNENWGTNQGLCAEGHSSFRIYGSGGNVISNVVAS